MRHRSEFTGAPEGVMRGVRDGDGAHVQFGAPAAVALAKDGSAYVADAEGSVIRRLRLPAWLPAGQDPPERVRGDFGRRFLGR